MPGTDASGGIINDPGTSSSHEGPRTTSGSITTFIEMPYQSMKLEPNKWQHMYFLNYFSGATETSVIDVGNLPMWAIAGIAPNISIDGTPDVTTAGHFDASLYAFNKLKKFTVTWKDFMWTVERTSAGGIQFKDTPVLEAYIAPTYWSRNNLAEGTHYTKVTDQLWAIGDTATNRESSVPAPKDMWIIPASGPVTRTSESRTFQEYFTFDGTQPISRTYNISSGWGYAQDLLVWESTATGIAWNGFYHTFKDWMTLGYGTAPGPEEVDSEMMSTMFQDRFVKMDRPNETMFLRCRNIPLGLTNVEVNLKFTVCITAEWDVKLKTSVPNMNFLPLPQITQPTFFKSEMLKSKNVENCKKRKTQ